MSLTKKDLVEGEAIFFKVALEHVLVMRSQLDELEKWLKVNHQFVTQRPLEKGDKEYYDTYQIHIP